LGFLLESYYEGTTRAPHSGCQEYSRLSQTISVSRYEVLKRVANLYFAEYLNDPEKAAETYEKILKALGRRSFQSWDFLRSSDSVNLFGD
jgi:hypothetical protein